MALGKGRQLAKGFALDIPLLILDDWGLEPLDAGIREMPRGGLAEFERALIIARTGDGRVRAQARGVRFGRPPALTSHQRQEAIQQLAEGATQADLARTYGVSQATISRLQPLPFEHASVAGA